MIDRESQLTGEGKNPVIFYITGLNKRKCVLAGARDENTLLICMFDYDETGKDVKEKEGSWNVTNVILKLCGNHATLTEAHEKNFYYGGKRKKLKYADDGTVQVRVLGRKSDASEEQKGNNVKTVQKRRNGRIRDLMNCNEDDLIVFETVTTTYQDVDRFNAARKEYHRKMERFCQTGKLYGQEVKGYIPVPDFSLKLLGVIEFQDGHRRKHKGHDTPPTGYVHGHHFQDTPYLPQVCVIHAKCRDGDLNLVEHYLNYRDSIGFFWSKVANRDTVWMNTEREVVQYLRQHTKDLPGVYFHAESKHLCVNALLWEQGHTHIRKLPDLRKKGKLSNAGEYLCQYIQEDTCDPRLRNRRAWYKRGRLERPVVYRDPWEVEQIIVEMNLWSVYVSQIDVIATYIGAMTYYFFNWWIRVYPWIRVYYEKKRAKTKMTTADWIVSGVIEAYQPLLL